MSTEGPLSGKRFNRLVKAMVEGFNEKRDLLINEMMDSGYPPFTVPLSPLEQYQKLVAMRGAGDPNYTNSPEAQAALAKLSLRFGPPPPLPGIFPTTVPDIPRQELGANLTADRLGPPQILGG